MDVCGIELRLDRSNSSSTRSLGAGNHIDDYLPFIRDGKLFIEIRCLEKLQDYECRGKEEPPADCGDEVDFFGEVVASFIVGSSHDVLHWNFPNELGKLPSTVKHCAARTR